MAVTGVEELRGVYTGTSDYDGTDDAEREYVVDIDDATEYDSITIIIEAQQFTASPLPSYGQALYEDSNTVVRGYFSREQDDKSWLITVTYRPRDPLDFEDTTETIQAPEERPAKLSWSYIETQNKTGKDIDGNAYVNSAKDPIDDPPAFLLPIMVVSITQYQLTFDPLPLMDFVGAVNSAKFLGAEQDTLKFKPASVNREFVPGYFDDVGNWHQGTYYYSVTYQFEYNPAKWQPVEILDRGQRVISGGVATMHADEVTGVLTGRTVRLNGFGRALSPTQADVFLEFYPYRQMDFSTLDLRV